MIDILKFVIPVILGMFAVMLGYSLNNSTNRVSGDKSDVVLTKTTRTKARNFFVFEEGMSSDDAEMVLSKLEKYGLCIREIPITNPEKTTS